jgi:hypothetical protein
VLYPGNLIAVMIKARMGFASDAESMSYILARENTEGSK